MKEPIYSLMGWRVKAGEKRFRITVFWKESIDGELQKKDFTIYSGALHGKPALLTKPVPRNLTFNGLSRNQVNDLINQAKGLTNKLVKSGKKNAVSIESSIRRVYEKRIPRGAYKAQLHFDEMGIT